MAAMIAIVFVAATVRSTVGFGEALIAMPLLALLLPIQEAAPLVALLSIINGLGVLIREWEHISISGALKLVIPAMISIPLGIWLLKSGDERIIKGLLAVFIFSFAIWSLRSHERQVLIDDRYAPLVGFIAGFLGGAYNTSGPPVVVYGSLRNWPPSQFRAMLQSFFTVSSIWVVAMHITQGMVTRSVLYNFAICFPEIIAAIITGSVLARRIPVERFKTIVHCLLIVLSIGLLWSVLKS